MSIPSRKCTAHVSNRGPHQVCAVLASLAWVSELGPAPMGTAILPPLMWAIPNRCANEASHHAFRHASSHTSTMLSRCDIVRLRVAATHPSTQAHTRASRQPKNKGPYFVSNPQSLSTPTRPRQQSFAFVLTLLAPRGKASVVQASVRDAKIGPRRRPGFVHAAR